MSASAACTGVAFARTALAGNPSDGYGGATLALSLPSHAAWAQARIDTRFPGAIEPPSTLVKATRRRFARAFVPGAESSALSWHTSIPRAVGLGGSSAIVIATLRALCKLHALTLEPPELAQLALEVEVEELGIAAGLQDRVAQAYGGLTFMDFSARHVANLGHGHYEALDPALLPPMLIAWRTDSGGSSGVVHEQLRARYERGDAEVLESLNELGRLARDARAALLERNLHSFARCVDASFDARRGMMALDQRHIEMIECARAAGASANFSGSGGAIVGVCSERDECRSAMQALALIGCSTLLAVPPSDQR